MKTRRNPESLVNLTEREKKILALHNEGKNAVEIGKILGIRPNGVRTSMCIIREKEIARRG